MAGEAVPAEPAVLILDPDAESRVLLSRILAEEDCRVIPARTGEEAWEILGREAIRLVIADPAVPGLDLGALARRRAETGGAPLLLLTSGLSLDLVEGQRWSRAADVVQRPLDPADFTVRVRQLVHRSQGSSVQLPVNAWAGDRSDFRELCPDILFSVPAWLLVVDADMKVRFANRSLLDSLSRHFSDITGRRLAEIFVPGLSDGQEAIATIRNALADGVPRGLPAFRFRTATGDERAVDLQATPIDLPGGRHVLVIFHDVSEHFWSREAIRQEKRKLEEIVNGMGASLAVLDPDLKVIWANKTFEKWFGEMWGKRFHHALRGLVLAGELEPVRIFTEAEYMSKEWAHIDAHGNRRYYRNIILPARDAAGHLKELVLVTQDQTEVTLRAEQHRMLRELATLMQTTLELDRLLYIILTCLTAGHALGFNRAFIFLADQTGRRLEGRMGVGPASREEAFTIWADLAASRKSLADLTTDYDQFLAMEPGPLTRLAREQSYSLDGPDAEREILVRAARENHPQIVRDAWSDPRVTPGFRERFGVREFACTPLKSKGRMVGVMLVDNVFSDRTISEEQAGMLDLFSATAGLAVDNARTYAELKSSLSQLEEAQEAAIQAERLATVGRLAAHVAHEIRNPLVTIGGFAASVRRHPEDVERVRRATGIIYEEVLRLEAILSGVMDFTRPAAFKPEQRDLNDVVCRLVDPLREELREKSIEFVLALTQLPRVRIDEKQFHQALLNLIRNAIESVCASVPAERGRRLELRTRREGDAVCVDVRDNGEGVPDDLMPVLFEPFISRKAGGTGLGLAVVRKILLDHGGDATAVSRRGEGATFTLRLPLAAEEKGT